MATGPRVTAEPAAARVRGGWTGERSGADLDGGDEFPGSAPAEAGPGEALLRQVFEDNLRLRQQLEQLAV
jgi:hypothetical protein